MYGLRRAWRMANKLLRLCPGDNLGVRCGHPVLAALCSGNSSSTQKSIKRALATGGPSGQLHAGLAQLLLAQPGGLENVLQSVLHVPEFGACLTCDAEVRPLHQGYARPRGYEDPWAETIAARAALSTDDRFYAWLTAVLADQELQEEEARLEALEGSQGAGGNWSTWREQVPVVAKRLALVLQARYPFTPRTREHPG